MTHVSLHATEPLQTPLLHASPDEQGCPQDPQLLTSDEVLASQPSLVLLLQSAYPLEQAPNLQVFAAQTPVAWGNTEPQLAAQAPQFEESLSRFTHSPEHVVGVVLGQLHLLEAHCCELLQEVPHAPQLLLSEVRSTQLSPHEVLPPEQLQAPFEHTPPAGQLLPQLPQFFESLAVFTHDPEQQLVPSQVWPQEPQWSVS